MVSIKEEALNGDMDIGPVVLQPTDMHYMICDLKQEPFCEDDKMAMGATSQVAERLCPFHRCYGDLPSSDPITSQGSNALSPSSRAHEETEEKPDDEMRKSNNNKIEESRLSTADLDLDPHLITEPIILENKKVHGTHQYNGQPSQPQESLFQCDICAVKFILKCALQTHILRHHVNKSKANTSDTRTFKLCVTCNRSYADLDGHLCYDDKSHHANKENRNQKGYPKKQTMGNNFTYHERNKSYQCNSCYKHYDTLEIAKRHFAISCIDGGTNYNMGHPKNNTLQCDQCGLKFALRASLQKHIRTFHMGESHTYICDICKNEFKNKWNLKVHIDLHNTSTTIQKTHKCRHCNKIFQTAVYLNRHIDRMHLDRVQRCNICHNGIIKGNFDKHQQQCKILVKRKKPCARLIKSHPCSKCSKVYLRRFSLNRHYRKKHLVHTYSYKSK